MGSEGSINRNDEWMGDGGGGAGIYNGDDACPAFDIRLIVEPFSMAQQSIRCTPDELSQAATSQTQHFSFGWESQIVTQDIVMRSDDQGSQ
jgi:hypothetical protein